MVKIKFGEEIGITEIKISSLSGALCGRFRFNPCAKLWYVVPLPRLHRPHLSMALLADHVPAANMTDQFTARILEVTRQQDRGPTCLPFRILFTIINKQNFKVFNSILH